NPYVFDLPRRLCRPRHGGRARTHPSQVYSRPETKSWVGLCAWHDRCSERRSAPKRRRGWLWHVPRGRTRVGKMSSSRDEDNLEARATTLLRERFRGGSWLIVAGLLLFAVADFFINPGILAALYAIAAVQLGVVAAGLAVLPRTRTRRQVTIIALGVLAGVFTTAAYSDVISHNTQST